MGPGPVRMTKGPGPVRMLAHEMYLRPRTKHMLRSSAQNRPVLTQPALAKTASQPNLATLV